MAEPTPQPEAAAEQPDVQRHDLVLDLSEGTWEVTRNGRPLGHVVVAAGEQITIAAASEPGVRVFSARRVA